MSALMSFLEKACESAGTSTEPWLEIRSLVVMSGISVGTAVGFFLRPEAASLGTRRSMARVPTVENCLRCGAVFFWTWLHECFALPLLE